MERKIKKFLKIQKEKGLLRTLTPVTSALKGKVRIEGKEYINFSSNDYLGLSSHPEIISKAKEAASFGAGIAASRLMAGSTCLHHRLEECTAKFKNKPEALVFNSGYQANVGIISALFGRGDVIFSDRLNHASIVDGIRLSGAKLFRFQHNSAEHLEELLKKERNKYSNALIVTETVFSMDGDIAPIKDIVPLKEKYGCMFMVDEAHATGIFGRNGSGMVEREEITSEVDIIMGTFSKALGSFGAYAAVSSPIKKFLINTCRSFIYSTALPPAVIAANLSALEVVKNEPHRRETLLKNAGYLRGALKEKGFQVRGESQIVPVVIGGNSETVSMSEFLKKKGYWTLPVRPPTVPNGEARLRVSLCFGHGRDVLDRFVECL
ncbi:MAG: 8-amino-7-oxononanoate synthase [Candidatus Omnitrophota bacterium]